MDAPDSNSALRGGRSWLGGAAPARAERRWRGLYRLAVAAAWLGVALIPVQVALFLMRPPPESAQGFFAPFQRNALLGFLSLDPLYLALLSQVMGVRSATSGRSSRASPSPHPSPPNSSGASTWAQVREEVLSTGLVLRAGW